MKHVTWRAVVGAAAAALILNGCGLGTSEDPTTAAAQAIEIASSSTNAVEVANLMRGPADFRAEAAEGFRCDAEPEVTYVDVCGRSLPATVHLEWSNCTAPERPRP
jgi:hypothetical protein